MINLFIPLEFRASHLPLTNSSLVYKILFNYPLKLIKANRFVGLNYSSIIHIYQLESLAKPNWWHSCKGKGRVERGAQWLYSILLHYDLLLCFCLLSLELFLKLWIFPSFDKSRNCSKFTKANLLFVCFTVYCLSLRIYFAIFYKQTNLWFYYFWFCLFVRWEGSINPIRK